MQRKKFYVPRTLYEELKKAAEANKQTFEQYLDDLLLALICRNPSELIR